MAEIPENEPTVLTGEEKTSIIKNSGIRDTEKNSISVWCTEDIDEGLESANRRFIRQQAKYQINRFREDKLEGSELATTDDIDEALDRIIRARQFERDKFKDAVPTGKSGRRKQKQVRADNRLDLFIDKVLEGAITKISDVYT